MPKKCTKKKSWNKSQEEILRKLKSEGKSSLEIFKMKIFPYSKNSIQKKICRMGLSKNSQNVLSKTDIIKLKKFLIKNWKEKTVHQLVEIWNNNNMPPINKNKIIYHLNSLGLKISHSEVKIIDKLNKEEKIIREETSHKSAKLMEEMIRSKRVEVMRRRAELNKDIWSGVNVQDSLFEDFAI
jgi:hypothetical protein